MNRRIFQAFAVLTGRMIAVNRAIPGLVTAGCLAALRAKFHEPESTMKPEELAAEKERLKTLLEKARATAAYLQTLPGLFQSISALITDLKAAAQLRGAERKEYEDRIAALNASFDELAGVIDQSATLAAESDAADETLKAAPVTQTPEVPTQTPEVPVQNPEVPTQTPEVPNPPPAPVDAPPIGAPLPPLVTGPDTSAPRDPGAVDPGENVPPSLGISPGEGIPNANPIPGVPDDDPNPPKEFEDPTTGEVIPGDGTNSPTSPITGDPRVDNTALFPAHPLEPGNPDNPSDPDHIEPKGTDETGPAKTP